MARVAGVALAMPRFSRAAAKCRRKLASHGAEDLIAWCCPINRMRAENLVGEGNDENSRHTLVNQTITLA